MVNAHKESGTGWTLPLAERQRGQAGYIPSRIERSALPARARAGRTSSPGDPFDLYHSRRRTDMENRALGMRLKVSGFETVMEGAGMRAVVLALAG